MLCNELICLRFCRMDKGSSSHIQWGLGSQIKQPDFFFFLLIMTGWLVKERFWPVLSDIHIVSVDAVFIYFVSDLSVFPQYDANIKLPVINENYRNSYSSWILQFTKFYFESFCYSNHRLKKKKKWKEKTVERTTYSQCIYFSATNMKINEEANIFTSRSYII